MATKTEEFILAKTKEFVLAILTVGALYLINKFFFELVIFGIFMPIIIGFPPEIRMLIDFSPSVMLLAMGMTCGVLIWKMMKLSKVYLICFTILLAFVFFIEISLLLFFLLMAGLAFL